MNNLKHILLMVLLMVASSGIYAQCAMCKATVESGSQSGSSGLAEGINSGIIYLMGVPYLLMGIVALVYFRKPILGKLKGRA